MVFSRMCVTLFLACLIAVSAVFAQNPPPQPSPCNNENPECQVNPPLTCDFIANDEYSYQLKRPTLANEVLPALQKQFRTHNANYPTYTLPITFLWNSLGIGDLMQDPAESVLPCCKRDVLFTHSQVNAVVANFAWSGTAFDVPSKANPILMGTKITISIPAQLQGTTFVAAGISEFHFKNGSRPHLKIVAADNSVTFDQPLSCMRVSLNSVIVRPPGSHGTQTNPILVIHP